MSISLAEEHLFQTLYFTDSLWLIGLGYLREL